MPMINLLYYDKLTNHHQVSRSTITRKRNLIRLSQCRSCSHFCQYFILIENCRCIESFLHTMHVLILNSEMNTKTKLQKVFWFDLAMISKDLILTDAATYQSLLGKQRCYKTTQLKSKKV